MKRKILALGAAIGILMGSGAHAQLVKSTIVSSNGVTVTKYSDDFARSYEYSTPRVRTVSAKGAIVSAGVAKIWGGDEIGPTNVRGFLIYRGDWRHFDRAVFRGGGAVNFTNTDKDVGSCRGGCLLNESFTILLSPAEIAAHAEDGKLPIQISSQSGDTALLEILVADFEAINEIAK